MNYAQLRTAVQDYCENTFSDTDFATMTKLAEQKIYNSVQLPSLRKNATGALTSGNSYMTLPTDLLSIFELAVIDGTGAYTYLINKDVNFIREAYPTPTSTGVPKHYAIFGPDNTTLTGTTLLLGPTPSSALSTELHYFFQPTSIVTATNTWLGDNFDSVLFNAVMVEAIRFMKGEPDLVTMYFDQYTQSLLLLKSLSDGKLRQDAYRSGQLRAKIV